MNIITSANNDLLLKQITDFKIKILFKKIFRKKSFSYAIDFSKLFLIASKNSWVLK